MGAFSLIVVINLLNSSLMSNSKKDAGGSGQVSAKDERKLKPIFDLVDEGNYKQAISQLDKFLKRSGNEKGGTSVAAVHQAKALKCLCLWRMPGRQTEAAEQVKALIDEGPDDEGSLSVFALCLRDMRRNAEIEQLYVKAVDKNPKNEDLLNCLIMAHVRTDNFKMQQLRSLQLNKLTASPNFPNTVKTFYYWAVMAVFLQAKKDKENGMKVQLPLAKKMMEKSVNDSKPIGATKLEQVDLLLMILEELKDFKSALQVFTDNILVYDKELPVLRERRKAEYLDGMGSYTELITVCKGPIISMGDAADWFFFEKLINAHVQIELSKNKDPDYAEHDESSSKITLEGLKDLVQFLLNARDINLKSIGHHFALLHLRKQLDDFGLAYEDEQQYLPSIAVFESLPSLVLDFYQSFGHKSPFFNYVRPCLTTAACESLISSMTMTMMSLQNGSGDEVPLSLADMYSLMSICEVERLHSREKRALTQEQCVSRSETLTKMYRKYLPLGAELQPTEPQFSSKFVILASHYLIDAYMLSETPRNQKYLWAALDRLKEATLDSPVDSQLLMVMLRIYQQMGIMEICGKLMDKMQIKQFLLQTTSWVVCNRLVGLGYHEDARLLHPSMIKYIQGSVHQVPDYLIQGYRNGVYRKIDDMLQWKQSLLKSFSFIKCIVEELLLDIVEIDKTNNMESRRDEMREFLGDYKVVLDEWDLWVDDRDLDLNYSREPTQTNWSGDEVKKLSYNIELSWLKTRYTLASSLAHLICLFSVNKPNNAASDELSKPATSLTKLCSDLKTAVRDCLVVYNDVKQIDLFKDLQGHPFSPFMCPISQFVQLEADKFYCQLIESFSEQNMDDSGTNIVNGFDRKDNFQNKTETKPTSSVKLPALPQPVVNYHEKMANLDFLISGSQIDVEDLTELKSVCEMVSIYALCVAFLHGGKKSSKTSSSSEGTQVKEMLQKLSDGIKLLITRVQETEWSVEVDVDLVKTNLNSCLSQINKLCTSKIDYLINVNV